MLKNCFTICVDMDDTIENLLDAWLKWLNKTYNRTVTIDQVDHWELQHFYPDLSREQIFAPLDTHEFWKTVTPKEDAIKYLKLLSDEHQDIYICTNSHYLTIEPKVTEVLERYFSFLDIKHHLIIIKNKQMVKCDIMIDDGPQNLKKGDYWKILISAPHNKSFDERKENMLRVDSWEEIYQFIKHLDLIYSEKGLNTISY